MKYKFNLAAFLLLYPMILIVNSYITSNYEEKNSYIFLVISISLSLLVFAISKTGKHYLKFFKKSINELKIISWSKQEQTFPLLGKVLSISCFSLVFLYFIDNMFTITIEKLLF